jgi:hypothetical protein
LTFEKINFNFLTIMASSSSSISIGKKSTSPECQLLLCLEMSAHDDAFVSPQRATLLPEAYTTCYAKVNSIISDVGKQSVDSILEKYYSPSAAGGGGGALIAKKHEYSSLDSCLARMSLSTYSHTTVWTLVCQKESQFFCLVANDQLPFCALYAPTKGEYIIFADGNLESARNYLVEQYKLSEEEAISAIVCSVEIKKEPKVSVPEEVVTLEAKVPIPPPEDTPPPPTAVVQEAAPAAPKKKVVRKRTAAALTPAIAGAEEPETKKAAVEESEK